MIFIQNIPNRPICLRPSRSFSHFFVRQRSPAWNPADDRVDLLRKRDWHTLDDDIDYITIMPPEVQPPMQDQSPEKMAEYFASKRKPEAPVRREAPRSPEKKGPDFGSLQANVVEVSDKLNAVFVKERISRDAVDAAIRDFPEETVATTLQFIREQNRSKPNWLESSDRPPALLRKLRALEKALDPSEHTAVQDINKADELRAAVQEALGAIE